MPCINLAFDPQRGPLLEFLIGVSTPRKEALIKAGETVPDLIKVTGLIDTGASNTCVDPTVIQQLELPSKGTIEVSTPSTGTTPHQCSQFDISIHLVQQISLTLNTIPVMESHLINQGIHALVGRDILGNCILHYNGITNQYSLSF